MKTLTDLSRWRCAGGSSVAALSVVLMIILQGCSTPPAPSADGKRPEPVASPRVPQAPVTRISQARNPKEYRRDAASHLYAQQPDRIYSGRLPSMLYAVGVLNVEIDRQGQVQSLQWMRAPKHAPQVMAEIEKMVRAAAPYPAPAHMAGVTYTDVWLWHKSGKFQLDTLTEGQD